MKTCIFTRVTVITLKKNNSTKLCKKGSHVPVILHNYGVGFAIRLSTLNKIIELQWITASHKTYSTMVVKSLHHWHASPFLHNFVQLFLLVRLTFGVIKALEVFYIAVYYDRNFYVAVYYLLFYTIYTTYSWCVLLIILIDVCHLSCFGNIFFGVKNKCKTILNILSITKCTSMLTSIIDKITFVFVFLCFVQLRKKHHISYSENEAPPIDVIHDLYFFVLGLFLVDTNTLTTILLNVYLFWYGNLLNLILDPKFNYTCVGIGVCIASILSKPYLRQNTHVNALALTVIFLLFWLYSNLHLIKIS